MRHRQQDIRTYIGTAMYYMYVYSSNNYRCMLDVALSRLLKYVERRTKHRLEVNRQAGVQAGTLRTSTALKNMHSHTLVIADNW